MNNNYLLSQNSPPNTSLAHMIPNTALVHSKNPFSRIKFLPNTSNLKMGKSSEKGSQKLRAVGSSTESIDEDDDDIDTDLCPVDCVREFYTDEEFLGILDKEKESKSLVVVDFYRTSCGSCKYIEHGFGKLCRGAGDNEDAVIFLKHNVIDEYDEQSEVAERLRIKAVPLFQFYRDGVLLESFPTRDKERILAAIQKYTSPS